MQLFSKWLLSVVSFLILIYNFIFGACFRFTLKQKGGSEEDSIEITVYDYFVKHRNIELRYSSDLPCINVGKPKRPTFIPVEVEQLFPL